MRRAFVLQLGPSTQPGERQFEGWIEEVDTGHEIRFRTSEELLAFLADCFERSRERDQRAESDRSSDR